VISEPSSALQYTKDQENDSDRKKGNVRLSALGQREDRRGKEKHTSE
jgi:hypothetical protein